METAQEFLLKKGLRKVHQPHKRYNLSIGELVDFLNEYAQKALKNGHSLNNNSGKSNPTYSGIDKENRSRISSQVNT